MHLHTSSAKIVSQRVAVAGIIIDSFGELRGVDAALHQEMANKCFVCGLERFDLETKGISFAKHVEEDHQLWNYYNLIITLRMKNPNDYNGWEQYVMGEVDNKPPAFMPQNTCIAKQRMSSLCPKK